MNSSSISKEKLVSLEAIPKETSIKNTSNNLSSSLLTPSENKIEEINDKSGEIPEDILEEFKEHTEQDNIDSKNNENVKSTEKRSTEDISSLISDIPPVLSFNNLVNIKHDTKKFKMSSETDKTSTESKDNQKESTIESDIKDNVQSYEDDNVKKLSTSATNQESSATFDDTSIEELSFNGNDEVNLNFSTVGLVSFYKIFSALSIQKCTIVLVTVRLPV